MYWSRCSLFANERVSFGNRLSTREPLRTHCYREYWAQVMGSERHVEDTVNLNDVDADRMRSCRRYWPGGVATGWGERAKGGR